MKRHLSFLLPLSLLSLALASGCGSEDEAKPSLSRDQAPNEFAVAYCEAMAGCCDEATIDFDEDECIATATEEMEAYFDSYDKYAVEYDGKVVASCVPRFKALVAKCGEETDDENFDYVTSCEYRFFTGTLQPGEACTISTECAGEASYCDETDTCYEAEIRPHGKLGDDCSESCNDWSLCDADEDDDVKTGCYSTDKLWCDDGTCAPLGKVGDGCSGRDGCSGTLFCDDGACAALRTEGQPCAETAECEAGTLCKDGECTDLKGPGLACDLDEDCESTLCNGGVCTVNNASELTCAGHQGG